MPATIDREWIAAQLSKGIDAEQSLADEAKARAETPPNPDLAVLYHEIAAADARHRTLVEAIAVRYGHTPSKGGGGISEALTRLKDKVADIATTGLERLGNDLSAKANAVHWYAAWVAAFEAIGETESARELAAISTEEKAHRDALQQALNRLVTLGARGGDEAIKSGKAIA